MNLNKEKIIVTGGSGLIGKNLVKKLKNLNFEVLSLDSKNDLRKESIAESVFDKFKPSVVFHLAAKVGGIHANSTYKDAFYSDNVLINTNVVNASIKNNVRYIFAMGTGCAYPKRLENQTLMENDFLDGIPEVTNDAYAYAKRGLLVHLKSLAENKKIKFTYCLPANIYGPNDNFHELNSHVVPGLIRRFCDSVDKESNQIHIWGDGTARRDFLYIEDCVDAILKLSKIEFEGVVNVSSKSLTSIKDLAQLIAKITKFKGEIKYDSKKLSGQKQRIMNTQIMDHIGWSPKYSLKTGLEETISWFLDNRKSIRQY